MITIKEPKRMLEILKGLKPTSSRLFVFLTLTRKPYQPFLLTYNQMCRLTDIKNPFLAMKDLIEKDLVRRLNPSEYVLIVDLTKGDYEAN